MKRLLVSSALILSTSLSLSVMAADAFRVGLGIAPGYSQFDKNGKKIHAGEVAFDIESAGRLTDYLDLVGRVTVAPQASSKGMSGYLEGTFMAKYNTTANVSFGLGLKQRVGMLQGDSAKDVDAYANTAIYGEARATVDKRYGINTEIYLGASKNIDDSGFSTKLGVMKSF